MIVKPMKIENIPALLWGCPADRVIIAVHGGQSHKADEPIRILAENANAMAGGCQVLSFDLPEHGDRRNEAALCKVQTCVAELAAVSKWTAPTEILYGGRDDTCGRDTVEAFASRFSCGLEIVPDGEHYFHTPEQLRVFEAWLKRTGFLSKTH